jgi:glycosyltransferase involved in cell wall biosynthesis
MKKIAIVYHYMAHYREPIFRLLLEQPPIQGSGSYEYTLFSDNKSNIPSINLVNWENSVSKGGNWAWEKLGNKWFFGRFLWQTGLFSRVVFNRNFKAVIFLGNIYYLSTWLGIIISRLLGKKVILWTHGVRSKESGLKRHFRLLFYGMADCLFLYGNGAKDILIREGFSEDKLYVIYNSMSYSSLRLSNVRSVFSSSKPSLTRDKSETQLIYSGRLTTGKNLQLLIDAIYSLNNNGHRMKLLLVGDGPQRLGLELRCNDLGILNLVSFAGSCYQDSLLDSYFSQSDICVIPSSAGLSVLHAMSFGLPVITDDDFARHGPEVEAILPGLTGSYYKANELDSLTEKIRYWVDRLNADNHRAIETKCLEVVNTSYTVDKQLIFIENALNSMLA